MFWFLYVNSNKRDKWFRPPPIPLTEVKSTIKKVLDQYSQVFADELGCLKVQLHVKEFVQPKPRNVPFILREKVAVELQRLENLGVVSPVKVSKWATPMVLILKKNGTARVCGDYKVSANKALLTEEYPLLKVDDLVSGPIRWQTFY